MHRSLQIDYIPTTPQLHDSFDALVARPSALRRSVRAQTAILNAASALVGEQGYARTTIEQIAARAGVGKQTVYRWWRSKGALLLDAHLAHSGSPQVACDTGSTFEDLGRAMKAVVRHWQEKPAADLIAGVVAEAQTNAALAEAIRREFVMNHRETVAAILQRASDRGELREDVQIALALDALFGPLWYRLLLGHDMLDGKIAQEIVHLVWRGIRVG